MPEHQLQFQRQLQFQLQPWGGSSRQLQSDGGCGMWASCLIIISRHTSLWHYYNDCCSKIHNAPDWHTTYYTIEWRLRQSSELTANVLPAAGVLPLVGKQINRQTDRQTSGRIDCEALDDSSPGQSSLSDLEGNTRHNINVKMFSLS